MSDDKSKVTMDGSWNRTRDGRKAGVYSVGNGGVFSVHGWVQNGELRAAGQWTADGHHWWAAGIGMDSDLIRERKAFRFERWCNVYQEGVGVENHETKADADSHRSNRRIACVKVIIEGHEGDGLEVPAP